MHKIILNVLVIIAIIFLSGTAFANKGDFYIVELQSQTEGTLFSSKNKLAADENFSAYYIDDKAQKCCVQLKNAIGKKISTVNDQPKVQETLYDKDLFAFSIKSVDEKTSTPFSGKPTIGFGAVGITSAKEIGHRFVELSIDGQNSIYVKYCAGSEGLNFDLYKSKKDKDPFANYYYYLGYDIKPNCP